MDWVDRLRQAVDAKGKHSIVAADAGIHPSSLSEILNRVAKPQLETVIDLCRLDSRRARFRARRCRLRAARRRSGLGNAEAGGAERARSAETASAGANRRRPFAGGDAARRDVDGSRRDQRSRHSTRIPEPRRERRLCDPRRLDDRRRHLRGGFPFRAQVTELAHRPSARGGLPARGNVHGQTPCRSKRHHYAGKRETRRAACHHQRRSRALRTDRDRCRHRSRPRRR
jgi:hypothetical protein